jgi:4-methyl-5(b-hydroxyethyl)-thiazole monophosphate biosynthesis
MEKKALVILAEGFEEVEAVTPVDYLRRVGVEICTAALAGSPAYSGRLIVNGSHGIPVAADTSLEELVKQKKLIPDFWDAVILPGGMPGAANLAASKETCDFIKSMAQSGKWACAICAAPALVLSPLGLLAGRKFTCYPGMEEKVKGALWSEERTVVEKNQAGGGIITGRGAGTAGEFAIAIISALVNEAEGENLAGKILLNAVGVETGVEDNVKEDKNRK